ncbi:MAG: aminotransferase class I/II-fold pyridoxal phosphate-dependent enzyme [Thaumarchaeota archaeon]|nr:aminotransferase class I/II-fold pyridoxal phosphate-dependent enzyme [Nitrososphaerota archaeon]
MSGKQYEIELSTSAEPHIIMFEKATTLEKQGRKVIHLEIGEPDFFPPREVIDAMYISAKEGHLRYSSPSGIPQLRSALAQTIGKRYKVSLSQDNVIVTPGGRFAIYLCFAAALRNQGKAAIIAPDWPAYRECVKFVGGEYITLNTRLEDGWSPSDEEVSGLLDQGVGSVVINSPSNPTGKILSKETVQRVAEIAAQKGLTVISDEVYSDYVYQQSYYSILQEQRCRSILIGSFSKCWAMTGFRIGYAIAEPHLIKSMSKIQSLLLTNVPEFVQFAALKALECEDALRDNVQLMKKRVEKASATLSKMPLSLHAPEGGLYAFPRINKPGIDSMDFALQLLEKKGVAVAPGIGFGPYPDFIRITLSQRDDVLMDGLSKIGEMLNEYDRLGK